MKSYWKKRIQEQIDNLFDKTAAETDAEIAAQYKKTLIKLRKDIASMYDQIMLEDDPLHTHLFQYDKYWEMKNEIQEELNKLGIKESEIFPKKFFEMYENNKKIVGSQFGITEVNPDRVKEIINSVWCSDGKHWSSRIWTNKEILAQKLEDGLMDCVARGASHKELVKEITNTFSTSFSRADALVRTELNYVQNQCAMDTYEEAGIMQYEYLAENDSRICEDCEDMDGKVFLIAEATVGVNYPPLHPNCRCTVMPVLRKED